MLAVQYINGPVVLKYFLFNIVGQFGFGFGFLNNVTDVVVNDSNTKKWWSTRVKSRFKKRAGEVVVQYPEWTEESIIVWYFCGVIFF